jgi:hypothetical protein
MLSDAIDAVVAYNAEDYLMLMNFYFSFIIKRSGISLTGRAQT